MNNKRIWSNLQQNVFEDIKNGEGHTVVIARAGSGKTSVLIEGLKYIPKKINGKPTKTLMMAFGKDIAKELRDRAPSYVSCFTSHSLGFQSIKKAFGKVALDPNKTINLTQAFLLQKGFKQFDKDTFNTTSCLCRCISLCKSYLIDVPSKIDILIDDFDLDIGILTREDFISYTCQILGKCKQEKAVIDFDDMNWLPVVYNLDVGKYDRVFLDELQDWNAAQITMALSACKKDGRICGLGDPEQSIFSFRGADNNSIETIIKKLNAKTLPLSITYRCPIVITKLAQEIVPDIQAAPNAKEGIVKYIAEENFLEQVKPGDFVLSRTNAPLIYHCLALLRIGIPANIAGNDIGANLAYMVRKSEAKNVLDFLKWLYTWRDAEIARLKLKNRDPILILDKTSCLETLCEGAKSLTNVLDNIKELFSNDDDNSNVILSTVHKSKGLEKNRVFILMNTMRRGLNKEEDNITYVAFTRSKSELFLVSKKNKLLIK